MLLIPIVRRMALPRSHTVCSCGAEMGASRHNLLFTWRRSSETSAWRWRSSQRAGLWPGLDLLPEDPSALANRLATAVCGATRLAFPTRRQFSNDIAIMVFHQRLPRGGGPLAVGLDEYMTRLYPAWPHTFRSLGKVIDRGPFPSSQLPGRMCLHSTRPASRGEDWHSPAHQRSTCSGITPGLMRGMPS